MNSGIISEQLEGSSVQVIAGPDALGEVFGCIVSLRATKMFLVCGENVSKLPPVTELPQKCPNGVQMEMFDQAEPDPSDKTVVAGGQTARNFGAEVILAIGGGSSIDAGKAIAAEAVHPGWIATQDRPGQPTTVPEEILPVIAVPTTAGTGSEVTPFSVITFAETKRKLALRHEAFYPQYALLDPSLLVSAPRPVRVAAGMDALTHAVESYVSKEATDRSRKYALHAIGLISQNLRPVAEAPRDIQAQAALQRGAMIAGVVFSESYLGIIHAMALPLSTLFGVPHGLANAILLPYGMEFNRPAVVTEFANIAEAMGVIAEETDVETASREAVAAVERLAQDLGAARRMRDAGIEKKTIPLMAQEAIRSGHIPKNPRPVTLDDLVAVYKRAY